MNRPYIICHMVMSIDGKVTGDFLYREECNAATEEYYRLNRELPAQGFACGRVTMEGSFTGGWYPDLTEFADAQIDRQDYIADQEAARYAVAFNRKGRLGWKTSEIVDELSLVQVPVIAGADGKPLFEDSVICDFVMKEVVALEGGAQWLRFVKKQKTKRKE